MFKFKECKNALAFIAKLNGHPNPESLKTIFFDVEED